MLARASAAWAGHDLSHEARAILGANQGAYVESARGTILLDQAGALAVHPASVSKVPTTLALLRRFGPQHRFVTTFAATGRVRDGTLHGDLWVAGEGDPSLVDEDALLIAERLKQFGIRRVTGNLRAEGPLTFDWRDCTDGEALRQALSGRTPSSAWSAVREWRIAAEGATLSVPGIEFASAAEPTDARAPEAGRWLEHRPLVIHRSQPLLALLKSLNDYSNNIFQPFAEAAGGAAAVEALGKELLPQQMRAEIVLGDGAGADPRNRLSPRAAVRLLRALDVELAKTGHALVDVLPVAGVDVGTLRERLKSTDAVGRVVGKTGTFGSYGASALVGAISTIDQGTVYFAILNHDIAVPVARRRQDRFVRALLEQLHSRPWAYEPDSRPALARSENILLTP